METKKWWETTGYYLLNHSLINIGDVGRYVPVENLLDIPKGIDLGELAPLISFDVGGRNGTWYP